jgi:hypothetical protein
VQEKKGSKCLEIFAGGDFIITPGRYFCILPGSKIKKLFTPFPAVIQQNNSITKLPPKNGGQQFLSQAIVSILVGRSKTLQALQPTAYLYTMAIIKAALLHSKIKNGLKMMSGRTRPAWQYRRHPYSFKVKITVPTYFLNKIIVRYRVQPIADRPAKYL